ncbi:MAG: ornithine carbamoyltransferase [Spirochaetaceae bacterium]|jgi:ornithine carbamoyltransferase|nr:ornithine carbamoyltransferase [Spirochaetaceae bacterium]
MELDLKGRSLLTWLDYSSEEIRYLLELSKKVKKEKKKIHQRFIGKTIALIFEKRSTRTRCAFETAIGEEGGHAVFLSTDDIQLGAKETVKDTACVLGRMFDAIEFRGFKQSVLYDLVNYSGVPVYNGLTDSYHPTQVLADVMTIEENFGHSTGKHLCFIGDGRNNVAYSLMVISAKLGINFTIITPPELKPDKDLFEKCGSLSQSNSAECLVTSDINAVKGADAVYTDVWVSMGEEAVKVEREKLLLPYQVNKNLMEKTGNKNCIFLHCLPAIREEEVSAEIIDGPNSRVWDEAENRKHTIKAIMLATLGLV